MVIADGILFGPIFCSNRGQLFKCVGYLSDRKGKNIVDQFLSVGPKCYAQGFYCIPVYGHYVIEIDHADGHASCIRVAAGMEDKVSGELVESDSSTTKLTVVVD